MKSHRCETSLNKNSNTYLYAIIFFYICSGAFSMLQGIYIKELKIGEDFLGIIISSKIFAMAFFSIPCALIVNKIGKKWGLFLAMFLVSLFTILQGVFANRYYLLIFSSLQGAVTCFQSVSEGPFFMENTDEKNRLKLFSYSFADNVFSTMIGYFLFGSISSSISSYFGNINGLRYSIIISGIIGFISCFFIIKIKSNRTKVHIKEESVFIRYKNVLIEKYSSRYLIYNFIIGFGAGLVVPFFNVYLKYKVNATTWQIGIIMALAEGAMGIGGLITPFMARKLGGFKTIIICQVISIPFLMLIALPPSLIIVSAALFIRNGLMNMTGPITGKLSMEIVKENDRSIFASINSISSNLSRALSSILAGFIMKNFANGYEVPYFITSILYGVATYYFDFKNYKKDKTKGVISTC